MGFIEGGEFEPEDCGAAAGAGLPGLKRTGRSQDDPVRSCAVDRVWIELIGGVGRFGREGPSRIQGPPMDFNSRSNIEQPLILFY